MTWTDDLDPLVPGSEGLAGQGDDEIRLLKTTLVTTWPLLDVEITMGTAGTPPTSADVTALWDTLTSLASGVAGVFKLGMIMQWTTANGAVPTDWTICNGTNVNNVQVPDMIDLMIVGAGNLYSDGESAGGTGGGLKGMAGQHSHTTTGHALSVAELPSALGNNILINTKDGNNDSQDQHDQVTNVSRGNSDNANPIAATNSPISSTGFNDNAHTHGPTGTEADHQHTVTNVLPPYYALTYICYVGPTP
jgi:hypothetical protein